MNLDKVEYNIAYLSYQTQVRQNFSASTLATVQTKTLRDKQIVVVCLLIFDKLLSGLKL